MAFAIPPPHTWRLFATGRVVPRAPAQRLSARPAHRCGRLPRFLAKSETLFKGSNVYGAHLQIAFTLLPGEGMCIRAQLIQNPQLCKLHFFATGRGFATGRAVPCAGIRAQGTGAPRQVGYISRCTRPVLCYGHTTTNTPDPIRTRKLSVVGLD